MRTIVIATPVKLGLESAYIRGFVATLNRNFPSVKLEILVLDGALVPFSRNDLMRHAKGMGAQEIVFIDSDMGWTDRHFERLISHEDLEIVAGLYCKRQPGKPQWLMTPKAGAKIDPVTHLLEVEDAPTGFMKINLETVLPKLEAKYDYLEYNLKSPDEHGNKQGWEYFPVGVEGPRTPAARLERVKAALKAGHEGLSDTEVLNLVDEACFDSQPPADLRGEDYFFCHLARGCGIKIYIDFGMPPVPHLGLAAFPITPDMVGLDPAAKRKS